MSTQIKILIAEHDIHDIDLMINELRKSGINFLSAVVNTAPGYISAIKDFMPDIILSDYTFPSFSGSHAFKIKEDLSPATPFIFVSGTIGEELAVELIKNGATDFVLKDKIFSLGIKVKRALKEAVEQKEKIKAAVTLMQTLRDHEKIMNSIIDVICTINANGEFVKVSAASQQVWGYTPGELIGSKFMDLVYYEDAEITLKAAEIIVRGKQQIPVFENRYVHKNGKIVPIFWSVNWDDELQLMFCIAKDVTEKKKLEKGIENERDRFSEMFLQAPASMAILKGPDHAFQMANELYLNLTDRKNIIGKTVKEVFPEVESQGLLEVLDQVYKTGKAFIANEQLIKLKKPGRGDLKEVYLNFVYQAYHNGQNEIEGIFVFVIDITEQRKAKENLRATSERLLLATTSAKMGIWDWDIVNDIMAWDNRMYELYGIGKQHFTGAVSVWQNGVHPDDIERAGKEINDAITGIRDFNSEFRVLWPDKSVHFIEGHGIVSRDEAGVAVRMIGGNIDITERKAAEEKVIKLYEEVSKSEKFFKGVIESSDDMITILAPDGKTIYASPAVSKKFGYTNEECLNLNVADVVHPDDALILQEFIMKIMMHPGVPMECPSIRNRKKDGTYMWVEGALTNFLETEGINAIVANFRDVTEKKKLEKLLDKTNRLAAIGSWEIDVLKGTVFWSDITKEIREADPDFIPDLTNGMQLFIEGDHRNTITNRVKDCIEKGFPWDDELQIITQKGNLKWIRTIGEAEVIDGKCIKVYGSFQDIDKRKKVEIEVLKIYEEKNIILESIGDGFYSVDKDWMVTYWNKQAETMTGKVKDDVIGKKLWDVYPDMAGTPLYNSYLKTDKENSIQHFEVYFDADSTWMDFSIYPSATGISVYFRDVTKRKFAEQQIKSEKQLLRTLIDNIPDAIYFKDKSGRKLISNKFDYTFMSAETEAEVLGKTDLELLPPNTGITGYRHDMEILSTGEPLKNFEECFILKSGNPLWLLTTKLVLRNEDNEISGMLGIGRDITARKIAEEKLLAVNMELEKIVKELVLSNTQLEQFAYVASHDLQEPLRMVTSFLTLIEKRYGEILDEKGKQYIHFAVDGAGRMRQMILDLLEFSTIGKIEDKLEQVDLNEVVNEILILYHKQIQETNAVIKRLVLPVLRTSRTAVRQIFQNLISNSLKYRKEGVAVEMTIFFQSTESHWEFAVADNGIGIAPRFFEKIFVIFQRLHNKDQYSGTGIGLAITKKLVENLGGKVWVESVEGSGTTFYFSLAKNPSI
ncbi:MAG: PAS domain S-box protein [Bacteroidota bacterium]